MRQMNRVVILVGIAITSGVGTSSLGYQAAGAPLLAKRSEPKEKKSINVNKLQSSGDRLYEKRRYDDAIDYYTQILKIYPKHLHAKTFLAKSLYRLGRHQQAYQMFRQLKLEQLDPETSYEYGHSFYRNRKWPKAQEAFQRVPKGHPLQDLAGYFGGISAYRNKDYKSAIDLFSLAVVLPSKYLGNKTKYLKLSEAKLLEEKQRKEELKRLKENEKEQQGSTPPPATTQAKPETSTPAPYLESRTAIGLYASNESQNQDFSGTKELKAEQTSTTAKAQLGKHFPFSKKNPDGSHGTLQLDLGYSSIKQTESLLAVESDIEEQFRRDVINGFGGGTLLDGSLLMGSTWLVGESNWLGFALQHRSLKGKGEDKELDGSLSGGKLFFSRAMSSSTLSVEAIYTTAKVDGEEVYTRTDEKVSFGTRFGDKLQLIFSGTLSQYQYPTKESNGPDWVSCAKSKIIYSPHSAIDLAAQGFLEIQNSVRTYNPTTDIEVAAINQNLIGGGVDMNIKIQDWLGFDLGAIAMDREVQNIQPNTNDTKTYIIDNVPTYALFMYGQLRASISF